MTKKNFTLIEMLVVIAIIAILAAIVIPVTGMARNKARMAECRNNMCSLMKTMTNYANDHKQAAVYRAGGRNYAAVLDGNEGKTKSYFPQKQILLCTKATDKLDEKDFLNAIGMLNAINVDTLTGTPDPKDSNGWLNTKSKVGDKEKYSKRFSSFADSPDKSSVIYKLDSIKSPATLLMFADTYQKGAKVPKTYWNFTPDKASDGKYYVTLIHGGRTVGAFADAHAIEMDAGQLKECGTEVTAVLDDDFNEAK